MVALKYLARDLVGPHIIVVEHRGELLFHPTAGVPAEQVGERDGASTFLRLRPRCPAAPLRERMRSRAGGGNSQQLGADLHQSAEDCLALLQLGPEPYHAV